LPVGLYYNNVTRATINIIPTFRMKRCSSIKKHNHILYYYDIWYRDIIDNIITVKYQILRSKSRVFLLRSVNVYIIIMGRVMCVIITYRLLTLALVSSVERQGINLCCQDQQPRNNIKNIFYLYVLHTYRFHASSRI